MNQARMSASRPTTYVVRPQGHEGAPSWPWGTRKLEAARRFLVKWLRPVFVCAAAASLLAAHAAASAASAGADLKTPSPGQNPPAQPLHASLAILSSPPQYVSGGDARIEVRAPAALHGQLELWLNGRRVEPALQSERDRMEGVVAGMLLGDNVLELRLTNGKALLDSLKLTNHPITGPMFSGPQQEPFVCTTKQLDRQPLVDGPSPPGYAVRDAQGTTTGYSRHCSLEPFVTYWYRTTGDAWKELPAGAARPADMRTLTALGRTVDFVVRQERGTINRFIYSFAMLAPIGEDPAKPDLSLWNRRLQYWFQGGVGVGHSQGVLHGGSMNADVLAGGTAIVHSSGNNTGTHYNLQLADETALMTKERFVERYGAPLYTYGWGGSGGAIQQYLVAQNHPGVLDAALPVQSYPDMVTQTIHVWDCELLEHYMDATDRANSKWRVTKNRSWLVGMNAEEGPLGNVNDPLATTKKLLGYATATGSTECTKSWRGLTPLTLNPLYGRARNSEHYVPQSAIAAIRWTHFDDLRNIYGIDAQGGARTTFDNVGVQYGLRSLREGRITPVEFLDLNFKVGGWKHPSQMEQEGFPFFGLPTPWNFDPWSRRNMNLSPDPETPAPRTKGDPLAMRAAYTSGMVFDGRMPLPTIDHRQYLERELDMHNAQQSFVLRKRVIRQMGNSDHVVIWFTDTMPDVPRASQSLEAMAVMDEWMTNLRANPGKSIAENRPARAVDSCFDVQGKLVYAGKDAWDGIIDNKPHGPCTQAFPIYSTSRIVAGAPFEGGIYRCARKPVEAAVADGTYAPWIPDAQAIATLKKIFPEGVCDYGKPDQALPQ